MKREIDITKEEVEILEVEQRGNQGLVFTYELRFDTNKYLDYPEEVLKLLEHENSDVLFHTRYAPDGKITAWYHTERPVVGILKTYPWYFTQKEKGFFKAKMEDYIKAITGNPIEYTLGRVRF